VPTHTVLGRSAGITDEQLANLLTDPLPDDVFTPAEAALVRFARVSTRDITIPQSLYDEMAAHYSTEQIMEAVFLIGLSGLVNRFHATFLTDVDTETLAALGVDGSDGGGGACPIPLPPQPSAD
jgi:alkylhydroperoxidase family enzyme